MNDNNSETRIKSINDMIMEVACGNFGYKIERSDRNDELEALVVMVNLMAEEMKASSMRRGHRDNTNNIAGMTFILDHDLTIQSFNTCVMRVLLFDAHELEGKPFSDFLTTRSKKVWETIKPGSAECERPVELSFKTKQTLIVPAFCTVSALFNHSKHRGNIVVTAMDTILPDKEAEEALRNKIARNKTRDKTSSDRKRKFRTSLRDPDIRKIGEAHDCILQNLKGHLSLKDLAHRCGVNEFKLKHGFKQLYGTTIFRFLMEERLKKAMLLVQNTDMPLKEVSEMTGFKSFPHFSKAFRERYGYCPSDVKKQFKSDREKES